MNSADRKYQILIVDDEWELKIVRDVVSRIEDEGWQPVIVNKGSRGILADEYERTTLDHIDKERPDGIILDLHFGNHKDDRFRGIQILRRIVENYQDLPVLVFTRYDQGPDRWFAEESSLKYIDAKIDYIDKSASPDAVVLRLRRLLGTQTDVIQIGIRVAVDSRLGQVRVSLAAGEDGTIVKEITGAMFQIFRELSNEWYLNPGHVVRYWKFERYVGNEQVLRTRIADIRKHLGNALGVDLGSDNFIINVRGVGYYLEPIMD